MTSKSLFEDLPRQVGRMRKKRKSGLRVKMGMNFILIGSEIKIHPADKVGSLMEDGAEESNVTEAEKKKMKFIISRAVTHLHSLLTSSSI